MGHGGICKSGPAFIPGTLRSLAALLAQANVCPFSCSLLLLILITHHRDSPPESRFGPSLTNAPVSIDGHFPDEVKKHAQIGTVAQSSLADRRRGLRCFLLVDAISRSSTNIHGGTIRQKRRPGWMPYVPVRGARRRPLPPSLSLALSPCLSLHEMRCCSAGGLLLEQRPHHHGAV